MRGQHVVCRLYYYSRLYMKYSKAEALLEKYRRGETNAEENALLECWYLSEAEGSPVFAEEIDYAQKEEEIWLKIQQDRKLSVKRNKLWPKVAVGIAAAVATVVFGIWIFNDKSGVTNQMEGEMAYEHDAEPGKNTALLTLANGKTIQLNEAKNGVVIDAAHLKYSDGTAVVSELDNIGPQQTFTASTPRGGTYQVILPDGTKVWLNAASMLKFPTSFSGKDSRTVELAGEAYFEVSKDKAHPFVVVSKGQVVRVLGTHFNVNTYGDDGNIKTTLLEGSVNVADMANRNLVLKPNQQAVLPFAENNKAIVVKQVNAEDIVAWKNGQFLFNEQSLSSILRQLERWYDVDVDYSTVPDTRYDGAISRNVKLSKVLEMLEQTGNLKLKMEKNIIKVYQ